MLSERRVNGVTPSHRDISMSRVARVIHQRDSTCSASHDIATVIATACANDDCYDILTPTASRDYHAFLKSIAPSTILLAIYFNHLILQYDTRMVASALVRTTAHRRGLRHSIHSPKYVAVSCDYNTQ